MPNFIMRWPRVSSKIKFAGAMQLVVIARVVASECGRWGELAIALV